MKKIAIVYFSHHGQTRKIARALQECLQTVSGGELAGELIEVSAQRPDPALPPQFQAVVVGAPVHVGRFPRLLLRWVKRHRRELESVKSTLFSVSLNAADPRPESRKADARLLESFSQKTGWCAAHALSLGGALAYSQYGPLLRFVMKRISASAGGPTDTSRDYELTDWSAVDRLAHDIWREYRAASAG